MTEALAHEDAVAHYDLGVAYAEMGLASDAIRTMSVVLAEMVARELAECGLRTIFGPRAHTEALTTVIAALRAHGEGA